MLRLDVGAEQRRRHGAPTREERHGVLFVFDVFEYEYVFSSHEFECSQAQKAVYASRNGGHNFWRREDLNGRRRGAPPFFLCRLMLICHSGARTHIAAASTTQKHLARVARLHPRGNIHISVRARVINNPPSQVTPPPKQVSSDDITVPKV